MAKVTKKSSSNTIRKHRPALNPEARENQLISMAMDRAEQQLIDGTASSQVITHFLKLGTEKAKLEREKLEHETELLKAKTAAIESAKRTDEMYEKVIKAMMSYSSGGTIDEEEY